MSVSLKDAIANADYVLIGLGEEFNCIRDLREDEQYESVRSALECNAKIHMLPAWNRIVLQRKQEKVKRALEGLAKLVKDKNYFVVSVCTNGIETEVGFKQSRVVSPCGNSFRVQCGERCGKGVRNVSEKEWTIAVNALNNGNVQNALLGKCEACGAELVFNSVYAEKYDESGYLPMWEEYTKWLQRTLNRKVCVLELGVGLTYPSVIRWPFEKIGFFNQKASFVRVHETLYQLSEDLKDKGISVAQNSIDWLLDEAL